MKVDILYEYIINPKKALSIFTQKKPLLECLIILFCISLTKIIPVQAYSSQASFSFLCFILSFASLILLLFLQTAIIDFVAQLFKLKSKSLTLFCWFGFSLMPLLLLVPTTLFATSLGSSILLFKKFIITLIVLGCLSLQVLTIKTLYDTSVEKSLLIYFLPLAIILFSIGALILISFIVLLTVFS